jgi:hypothetical protein
LADVGFESFAQAEIARLEELRVAALEERIAARLSEGEHALVAMSSSSWPPSIRSASVWSAC